MNDASLVGTSARADLRDGPFDLAEIVNVTPQTSHLEPASSRLSDFLRRRQDEIIADWAQRMRTLSPARELSQAAIVDHLPRILTRIADIVESAHTGSSISLGDLPE